jgi:DinB superfamily
MEFRLSEAVESLAATPATVDALLRGRPEAWLDCRKGEGTFSPRDIVGHLIFGEMTDWIPRARQILEGRGTAPFEPFDRFGHREMIEGRAIGELLDQFADHRRRSLETLEGFGLEERQLEMWGTHPEFGPVTLRQLLATWVVHDLGHIAQLMRVLANEYRDAVGPWRAYLSIL